MTACLRSALNTVWIELDRDVRDVARTPLPKRRPPAKRADCAALPERTGDAAGDFGRPRTPPSAIPTVSHHARTWWAIAAPHINSCSPSTFTKSTRCYVVRRRLGNVGCRSVTVEWARPLFTVQKGGVSTRTALMRHLGRCPVAGRLVRTVVPDPAMKIGDVDRKGRSAEFVGALSYRGLAAPEPSGAVHRSRRLPDRAFESVWADVTQRPQMVQQCHQSRLLAAATHRDRLYDLFTVKARSLTVRRRDQLPLPDNRSAHYS